MPLSLGFGISLEVEEAIPTVFSEQLEYRFSGIQRLYGLNLYQRILDSHILVIGLGGVGSWVVEALARTGVGRLTLVDFDDVCVSNTNRQIQAIDGEIGKMKTQVLKARVEQIRPGCRVRTLDLPYNDENSSQILWDTFDCVLDCFDDSLNKEHLAKQCRDQGLPLVLCGSAAGRIDPTQIKVSDLSKTSHDPMLSIIRRNLRRQHGFPRGEALFSIPCVYSTEAAMIWNKSGQRVPADSLIGSKPLDCDSGMGTSMMVTASFGMLAVAECLKKLAKSPATPF